MSTRWQQNVTCYTAVRFFFSLFHLSCYHRGTSSPTTLWYPASPSPTSSSSPTTTTTTLKSPADIFSHWLDKRAQREEDRRPDSFGIKASRNPQHAWCSERHEQSQVAISQKVGLSFLEVIGWRYIRIHFEVIKCDYRVVFEVKRCVEVQHN